MHPEFIRNRAVFDDLVTPDVTRESSVLEFKREIEDWRVDNSVKNPERDDRKREARLEFARDAIQFANADGGCLLIGVNEVKTPSGKVAGTTNPVPAGDVQELIQWMHEALGRHASPNTFEPESITEIDDPGGKVIAVNVAPSPIMVGVWDDVKRTLQVPVRRGAAKYLLNPGEMEVARMNTGRAAKLRLREVVHGGQWADVDLAGTMYRRAINQGRVQDDLVEPTAVQVREAADDPETFELIFTIGGKTPTLRLHYDVIESIWIDAHKRVALVLRYPVVFQNGRLKLDVHPPRR